MSLNIKSPEVGVLVGGLPRLTDESQTPAVIVAPRERLDRTRRERDRQSLSLDLEALGKRCAAHGRREKGARLNYRWHE